MNLTIWRKLSLVIICVLLTSSMPLVSCGGGSDGGGVLYSLSTSVSPLGSGSVSPSSGTYSSGDSVTLTATPSPGYEFISWSGGVTGTSPTITITMNSNKSVTANFRLIQPLTPLNVKIDYFGIKSTHQPPVYWAPNTIQLYAVVDDGKTSNKYSYPSSNEGIIMSDFQLVDLREQTIFNTPSVGDYLRISIVAYSCEDKEAIAAIWKAIEAFQPGVRTFREFYESLQQKRELIGLYEHTWYPIDKWGIATSRYEEKDGDLLVWFRIWSNTEPPSTPTPTVLPDVKIQSVDLPSEVKRSPWPGLYTYPHTLTIVNNESISVKVKWQVNSSATGNFTSDEVLVPANSCKSITIRPWYENPPGVVKITYTISYKGTELDSRSGTVNVVP